MKLPTFKQGSYALFASLSAFILLFSNSTHAACTYAKVFQGEELEVGIMLSWATSSEEDNSLFIIEKAEDGGEFENIGTISAAGNSEKLKDYNFFDINIRGKYILYRLKQVDLDGTSTFSKSLFIHKEVTNNFMVAKMTDEITPGPFTVSIDAMINCEMRYELKDWKGITLITQNVTMQQGINEISIDLGNCKSGIYTMSLQVDEEIEELTFKKVDARASQKPKNTTAKKE